MSRQASSTLEVKSGEWNGNYVQCDECHRFRMNLKFKDNRLKRMADRDMLDACPSTAKEEKTSQIKQPKTGEENGKISQISPPTTGEENGRSKDIYVIRSRFESDVYEFKSGIAVVINNTVFDDRNLPDRAGSDVDASSLYQRFQDLGFESELLNNATSKEIEDQFKEIKEDKEMLKKADCLMVALLTHGTDEDTIHTRDNTMKLRNIMEQFNVTNCPELALKPKIFIVQACRGTGIGTGRAVRVINDDPNQADAKSDYIDYDKIFGEVVRIPNEADFLAIFATSQGYGAFRNSEKGSPFVRILSDELLSMKEGDDIYTVLTRVNRRVGTEYKPKYPKDKCATQMPCFVSHLTKQLILKA